MEQKGDWTITETDDRTRLVVKYDGAPIVAGMMDLADLVPALDAIRKTLVAASNDLNHGASQARVAMSAEVKGGSFEFAVVLFQLAAHGVLGTEIKTAVEIGKAVFGENGLVPLLKFVFGKSEKQMEETKLDNGSILVKVSGIGNQVNVTQQIIVSPETAQLYHRKYVRDRLWPAVEPLTKPGMRSVSFQPADEKPALVTPKDAEAFRPPAIEEILDKDSFETVEEVVDVIKPSFDEHKKWKLAIGDNVFGAIMGDTRFQNAVMRREILFGTGDKLEVHLGVRKHKNKNPDYIVDQVLSIIRPNEQLNMFGDGGKQ